MGKILISLGEKLILPQLTQDIFKNIKSGSSYATDRRNSQELFRISGIFGAKFRLAAMRNY